MLIAHQSALCAALLALTMFGCVDPAVVPAPASRRARLQPAAERVSGAGGGAACGAITYAGCCQDATLLYCSGTALTQQACAPASCGWSAAYGLYLCGASSAPDPTGQAPRDCPPTDAGIGAVDSAVPDLSPPVSSCGPLSYVGCCDGDRLLFCSGGTLLSLQCAAGTCGWSSVQHYHACDTTGSSDPSGQHGLACAAIVGDAWLPLDAGLGDAAAMPADGSLTVDAAPSDGKLPGSDAATKGSDGYRVVGEGLLRRDAALADVRPTPPALDASGLVGGRRDAALAAEDAGGCSCSSAASRPPGAVWLLLVGAVLAGRRRYV